jgi:hypothetical protein
VGGGVVGHWRRCRTTDFFRAGGAERERLRLQAARGLADGSLQRYPPATIRARQRIHDRLLILAYAGRPGSAPRGFERWLASARASRRVFATCPRRAAGQRADRRLVHSESAATVIGAIADPSRPLHLLVAGDPETNPLAQWLVMPEDVLGDVDELDAITTAHWRALTGGHDDDERLLWLMLREVCGVQGRPPLAWKSTETALRTVLATAPEDRAVERWLQENAPHEMQSDLLELWHDFWEERTESLRDDAPPEEWKRFMRAWLPMRESAAKR